MVAVDLELGRARGRRSRAIFKAEGLHPRVDDVEPRHVPHAHAPGCACRLLHGAAFGFVGAARRLTGRRRANGGAGCRGTLCDAREELLSLRSRCGPHAHAQSAASGDSRREVHAALQTRLAAAHVDGGRRVARGRRLGDAGDRNVGHQRVGQHDGRRVRIDRHWRARLHQLELRPQRGQVLVDGLADARRARRVLGVGITRTRAWKCLPSTLMPLLMTNDSSG